MTRLLVCWIVCCSVPAWAERWPIRVYTTADGLANDRLDRGTRDQLGYLWFATIDGVSRFDGHRFESFGVRDGLPSAATFDILATRDGVIWVATRAGLAWLDPRTRGTRLQFHAIATDDAATALAEDREGRLWIATARGLVELVGGVPVARSLGIPLSRPAITAIATDWADRSLWLGTWDGLVHRHADGSSERFPFGEGVVDDRVFALCVDHQRRLWISHVDEKILAIPLGERFLVAPGQPLWTGDGPGWLHHEAHGWARRAILEDSQGTVWIGTTNELIRHDDRGFHALTPANGVSDQSPTPLVEDDVGNLWIGTDARGVERLASHGLVTYDRTDGLDGTFVTGLAEARGELYLRTEDAAHPLHRFNGTRFLGVRPRVPDDVAAPAWTDGQTIAIDRDDRWWYPTSTGVAHYPRVARFADLATAEPEFLRVRDGLPGRDIARLFADHRGDVWIATMSEVGLARWARATGRLAPLAGHWPRSLALAFAEDRTGALWIGYDDGQLVRVRDGVPEVFGASAGVPSGSVTALLVDGQGRLWLGSDASGVGRIDDPTAPKLAITHYTTEAGLASDRVMTLVDDLRGRIYIGTSHGVDRLDPSSGDIGHLDTADGLPNNYVTTSLRSADGALWFGTKAGAARLVDDARPPAPPPPTYITLFRVTGAARAIAVGGDREVGEIALGSDENQLDIAFTSPALVVGESLRFQYRLEDGAAWSPPVAEREVHFPKLAPGRYQFSVRAVLGGNAVSPAARATFSILPPLWQRGWFVALAAITLGGLGYRLYRWRLTQLLAIERVRIRIATDLHDDLGSSLSRIAILSEVASQRAAASEGITAQIGDIGRSARELVDVASDIVWSTDPRRDDLKSLLVRLRSFASDVLEGSGIAWSMDAPVDPERIKLGPERRRQLFLILKEAVHNAARHAQATRVEITITRGDGMLAATVRDDGRGFDPGSGPDAHSEGNGLASMHARARRAGGTLRIESAPAAGTTIAVRLPLQVA